MRFVVAAGIMVEQVGFIHHPTIAMCGGSPDGLVDDDGGVEIKAPFNSANHLQTFLTGVPNEHIPQIQGLMWITGRQWWDFVSYDPRMPSNMALNVIRVNRDDSVISDISSAVTIFLGEVDELVKRIASKN